MKKWSRGKITGGFCLKGCGSLAGRIVKEMESLLHLVIFIFLIASVTPVYSQDCVGCSAKFDIGQKVVLTNTPKAGYYFAGWLSDMCYGTGQCSFTMPDRDVHVDAINLPIAMEELHIYAYGKEGGRVVSSPIGIDCTAPNICKASFPRDTKVTLTSTSPHKWRGYNCAVTASSCVVTMTKGKAGNVMFY